MRRIYLIDCPGIVPISAHDSETGTVLKGVVRVENLETPAEHIPALLGRVKKEHIQKTYGIVSWTDSDDFLTQLAQKMGKLLKGGEAAVETAAKVVLNDWIRGKLPFFVAPPGEPDSVKKAAKNPAPAGSVVEAEASEAKVGDESSEVDDEDVFEGLDVEEDEDSFDGEDDEDEDEEDSDADGLQNLAWDDVFGAAAAQDKEMAEEDNSDSQAEGASDEGEDSAAEDGETRAQKEKRMTTSKRKAENFYTHANVKNKKRGGAKRKSGVTASGRKERGSRVGANRKGAPTALKAMSRR